jgi:hypothetical protein
MSETYYTKLELDKHDFNQLVTLAKAHGISRHQLLKEALWWYSMWDELSQKERKLLCDLSDQSEMSNGDVLKRALHFYGEFARFIAAVEKFDDSIE